MTWGIRCSACSTHVEEIRSLARIRSRRSECAAGDDQPRFQLRVTTYCGIEHPLRNDSSGYSRPLDSETSRCPLYTSHRQSTRCARRQGCQRYSTSRCSIIWALCCPVARRCHSLSAEVEPVGVRDSSYVSTPGLGLRHVPLDSAGITPTYRPVDLTQVPAKQRCMPVSRVHTASMR